MKKKTGKGEGTSTNKAHETTKPSAKVASLADDFLAGDAPTVPEIVEQVPQNDASSETLDGDDIDEMDMVSVMAAMAEVNGEIKVLQGDIEVKNARLHMLYKRYQALQDDFRSGMGIGGDAEPIDRRKAFNPEKNLKISAIRAYGWAKKAKRSADEAKLRVTERTLLAAKSKYSMTKLPDAVVEYINHWHKHYDEIKEEDVANDIPEEENVAVSV
jgi:hypothetical protein